MKIIVVVLAFLALIPASVLEVFLIDHFRGDIANPSTTTPPTAALTVESSNRPPTPPGRAGAASVGTEALPETGRDMKVPIAAGVALLTVGAICVAGARRGTRKERT